MNRKYAWYLIRHKWFVFLAGLRTGAPLWRLIIHDWSKLRPSEWKPYATYFYGPEPVGDQNWKRKLKFDRAWLAHQHRNDHHWQHWILQEDGGQVTPLYMPPKVMQEMVADWMGAGRAITGRWDVMEWYTSNAGIIHLHPITRQQVELLIMKVAA